MVKVYDIKGSVRSAANPYDWVVDPNAINQHLRNAPINFKYANISVEDKDRYMFLLQPNNTYNHARLDKSSGNFEEIAFSLVGDTGDGNTISKEVGKLIQFWRNDQGIKGRLSLPIMFNILLGDNFYETGFKKDNLFESCVTQVFGKDVEQLALLGNHDYNMWSWGQRPLDLSGPTAFRADFNYSMTGSKKWFNPSLLGRIKSGTVGRYHETVRVLREVALTYSQTQPKWFLPNRYYTVRIPNYCVFIFIDSNRLLWDYNQQAWINNTWQKITNKGWHKNHFVMLVSHHPFITLGKRKKNDEKQKEDDIKLYGDPKTIINATGGKVLRKGTLGRCNMELIKDLTHNFVFDGLICAHDHFMESLIPNTGHRDYNFLVQITSGAGGHQVKVDPTGKKNPSRSIEKASQGEAYYALPDPNDPEENEAQKEAKKYGLFSQFYKGAGAFKMHMRPNRQGFFFQGMAAIKSRDGGFYTRVIEPISEKSYTGAL